MSKRITPARFAALLLAVIIALPVLTFTQEVEAANEIVTLKVGSTEIGTLVRTNTPYHSIWYKIEIAEDGLYKTSLIVQGDAYDYYSAGIRGIALFDKSVSKEF
jgi:hypothetical protein